jgi:hypothetical protein
MALTTQVFNNVLQSSGFTPEQRIVREALQNSADAHRDATDLPVSVTIEKRYLTGEEKINLVQALQLDQAGLTEHAVELPEGNALEAIADPSVPLAVLTISDYNTKGLGGQWDGTGEHDHFGRLVINLGIDDKADAAMFSGGSFGFGKTVYGKASGIGVVGFYSVFQPTDASAGAHARFMATGLFKPHEVDTKRYRGFAFFGAPNPDYEDETTPLIDDSAHEFAERCGLERRADNDFGTTILIVDCDYDLQAMKTAVELYWWPRLLRNDLDVRLIWGVDELIRRPKQNPVVQPFISCFQNIVSDTQSPPKAMLFKADRRIGTSTGAVNPGVLATTIIEGDENPHKNSVALMRAPGMVVQYYPCGSDSYEPCVGVFVADADVEKILTFSEPQMHNEWDSNADRLKTKFPEDGERVVNAVMRRIEMWFRDFQRRQEPPLPPGGLKPKELMKLLGRFLDVSGINPNPPPPPAARPLSISVSEDRVQRDGEIWDQAAISLELKDDFEGDELDCLVKASIEVVGDSSMRLGAWSQTTLEDEDGNVLALGAPPEVQITMKKGSVRKFVALSRTDEISTTRLRVAVEEV